MKFAQLTYRCLALLAVLLSGLSLQFWPIAENAVACDTEQIELADPKPTTSLTYTYQAPAHNDLEFENRIESYIPDTPLPVFHYFIWHTNSNIAVRYKQVLHRFTDYSHHSFRYLLPTAQSAVEEPFLS